MCLVIVACFCHGSSVSAQECPPNLDFETGTFDNWTCYLGYTFATFDKNAIVLSNSSALPGHHKMYSSNTGELDPYGGFPVTCPNGSGHSVKIGDTNAGAQAEGISYDINIPPNENNFSFIYHYAVVLQSPHHQLSEQPRMEIVVKDVIENSVIECASFTFIAEGTSLPGFEISPNQVDTNIVLYKDWTSVSVDLAGYAGKTIRLFFKTADCTWSQHFGYAYIDVDSECDGSFIGSKYCPDDSVVNVVAPFGFKNYTWFDSTLTDTLGTQQTLRVAPPKTSREATLAVSLIPYDDYGCPKTLFAVLENSLDVRANAGKDTFSCNGRPVPLGIIPRHGLAYQWTPSTGLNDPAIANPVAGPLSTTSYVVTTTNSGGGCASSDTVEVKAYLIDTALQVAGKASFCFDYGDSALLVVRPHESIQWFVDEKPIMGAIQQNFRVRSTGSYYAAFENAEGCRVKSREQIILIDTLQQGISYPTKYAVINTPLALSARPIGESIRWNPAISLDSDRSFTPMFRGRYDETYKIAIKTPAGCLTVDTQTVKTVANVEIYVPNAFTPNGDGLNDFLYPTLRGVKQLQYFKIFNRAGQLIYETNSGEPGWNGRFKGALQSEQAVAWILSCIGADDKEYFKKGVTLLIGKK